VWVTIDQIESAKKKLKESKSSRRIIITPNNPWEKVYDLNPLLIQFLLRHDKLYTSALFADYPIQRIVRGILLVRAIQKELIGGNTLRLGPTALFFMPGTSSSRNLDLKNLV